MRFPLGTLLVLASFSVCVSTAGAQPCDGVYYQQDPRDEPWEAQLPSDDWTAADVLIVFSSDLTSISHTTFKMKVTPWTVITGFSAHMGCSDRDYHGQPGAANMGSGVLVGTDRVLTARHVMHWGPTGSGCTEPALCSTTAFVFGYGNFESDQWQPTCNPSDPLDCWVILDKSNVYFCEEQWDECNSDPAGDWAVLRLDRTVQGRNPLPINDGSSDPGTNLTIIGHPNRIPMKAEQVQLVSIGSGSYQVNGHVLKGNSGGMVIDNATGEVIGTLSGGGLHVIDEACDPPPGEAGCFREDFVSTGLLSVTAAYLAENYIP